MDKRAEAGLVDQVVPPFYRRGKIIAGALLVIYLILSLFTDPGGYLSTDVGGKTASLEAMDQRNDWDIDLGYWFAEHDPDGKFFPFIHSHQTPNEQWINTTSITMIYMARPLYAAGGMRAILLLPMLGAVATAVAAGLLERRISAGSDGAASMWLVGLASPITIYALDFWEHALGLGAMALGVVAAIDAVEHRRPLRSAVLAGLAFGFAATMRQEALVYGFFSGLIMVVVLLELPNVSRQKIARALSRGSLMAGTTLAVTAAYIAIDRQLTGSLGRLSRGAETAGAAAVNWEDRARAAAATLLFPLNGDHWLSYALGFGLFVALVWVTAATLRSSDPGPARVAAISVGVLLASILLVMGPRFVPGMVPTTPLAVVGLVAALHFRRWLPLAFGVLPLPFVLAVQFPKGAIPQWAGRYLLLTGLILMVCAIALLKDSHPKFLAAVAVGALFITSFGVGWTIVRKDFSTDDRDRLEALTSPEDVVVWRDTVKARERGAFMIGRSWLGAPWPEWQEQLPDALQSAGIDEFIWIDEIDGELETFAGYEPVEELGELDFGGQRLTRFVIVD